MEDRLIKNETFKVHNETSFWNGFEFGIPGKYAIYNSDFLTYTAGEWTVTETDAASTQALADVAGGALLIRITAADNDLVGMQLGREAFLPADNKQIWFKTIIQVSDATQSDFLVGLSDTDTGLPTPPSDGITFYKLDGETNIRFQVAKAGVTSEESNVGTFVAATDFELGFKVSGTHLVEAYVNNFKVADLQTNIPTTEMRVSLAVRNGEAVAKTMLVKQVIAVQEL